MPTQFIRLGAVSPEMRNRVLGRMGESMGQVRESGLVYRLLPGPLVLERLVRSHDPRSWKDAGLATKVMQASVPIHPVFVLPKMGTCYIPKDPFDISAGTKVFLMRPKL